MASGRMMKAMTIDRKADTEITEAELAREYALFDELMLRWPDHWFVIVRGELIHSADPDEVTRDLRARGIGLGEVLVQRYPGPGPYRTP
jgi:hypothetical protein